MNTVRCLKGTWVTIYCHYRRHHRQSPQRHISQAQTDARRLSVSTSKMALLSRGQPLLQLLILFIAILHHCKSLEEDAAINEDSRVSERSLDRLSWHAREQLLDVVEQLGHITGMYQYKSPQNGTVSRSCLIWIGETLFHKRFMLRKKYNSKE